jgi:beta-glucanase (GH16 family)
MNAVKAAGLVLLIMLSVGNLWAAENSEPADDGYQLVWADEFDIDGLPNPDNWTCERGFVRNDELQWYQPENATCLDGLLVIEALREQVKNPRFDAESGDWRRNREFAEYTSACLLTRGKHQWKYGRFVMRGKIDVRPGLWPAFWTLGSARGWPGCGEIDVMEYYDGVLLANWCWQGRNRVPVWDDIRIPLNKWIPTWADDFHVWQLDWNPQKATISMDGEVLNEIDLTKAVNEGRRRSESFQEPHYLLLNLAIGGTRGGDPSKTEFPAKFEVDYVRVYQIPEETTAE